MSVVLFGYHNMGCIALEVLTELGIPVSAVVTHRDDPGENRWFESLGEKAVERDILVYHSEDMTGSGLLELVQGLAPDVLLSCYYRNMISEKILAVPRLAAINLHGSLLPRYRGRCPVNWQILHGETLGGVTLHHMVRQADAGDIVGQRAVPIAPDDTAYALFRKLEPAAEELLREMMPRVMDGTAPRIPQDHSQATYFGGRRPEDGRISWEWPARRIYDLIRAVAWPYPGAFSSIHGRKILVWWGEVLEGGEKDAPPGTVIAKGKERWVQTGDGRLKLVRVSWEGQSPDQAPPPAEVLNEGDRLL
ncbi:MAG: formyltransferase [Syntrophobacteraceae bacterium]|nr:formyltransferase [Syntrophobacteraceae bacterium]